MDPCLRKVTVSRIFFAHKTQYLLLTLFILVQQPIVLLPTLKPQLVLTHKCDLKVIEIRCKKLQINHFSG